MKQHLSPETAADIFRLVPVSFRFPGTLVPSARRVSILGPFNGCKPLSHPLAKASEGCWVTTIYFCPGRAVYCFDVDGIIWLDPNDDGRVPNGWGPEYSVRNVAPISEPASDLRPPKDLIPIQGGAQLFECGVEEAPEAVILRPSGEMDLGTVWIFRDALKEATARGRSIVIDMNGIKFIDSSVIHALLEHAGFCKQHRSSLVLAAPNGAIQKIIEITSLDDAIPVLAPVEVALDLLRHRLTSSQAVQTNDKNG